jgi:hypothetical protein
MPIDSTNALTTVSTFTAVVGLSADDAELAAEAINWASTWFNTVTTFKLKQRTLTEYYDGDGTITLFLYERPAASVQLYLDVSRTWTSDTLLTENTDFVVYSDVSKIVLITRVLPVWPQSVKVTYSGGFSTIPADLEGGCLMLARLWYDRVKNGQLDVMSKNTGAGTVSYIKDIPKYIQDIASQYSRWGGMA